MIKLRKSKPCLFHILKEVEEKGGLAWTLSAKEFDCLFDNAHCFEFEGKTFGSLGLPGGESVKVYRGK